MTTARVQIRTSLRIMTVLLIPVVTIYIILELISDSIELAKYTFIST